MSDVARHTEFEAVVRRVGPSMLAYARRRVDPDTADDVVADALLVLWRRRLEQGRSTSQSTGDAEDKEIAWAIGITRGCLANTRRSARRHIVLVGRLAGHQRPAPAPDVSSTEIDEDLRAALGSLREDDQELLRLGRGTTSNLRRSPPSLALALRRYQCGCIVPRSGLLLPSPSHMRPGESRRRPHPVT
jgi:DNA-directed RNA polymerase specialized sigma24 family protein